ncbi:MAG: hypothetical protein DMG32_20185 [Acidobacteria bacterium]|nr:MAG: hypothetical protein DMG32_20185 [Acidobacteriota bacterium]
MAADEGKPKVVGRPRVSCKKARNHRTTSVRANRNSERSLAVLAGDDFFNCEKRILLVPFRRGLIG